MELPLVSCLTATYGRFGVLREALACFMLQDYLEKEMIILNNHEVPIYCEVPGVRVFNEPFYSTLGDCRERLLELAQGELVRTWDDDDLYLPWAISQGVEHIGSFEAWKPKFSWDSRKNEIYTLGENVYEASITFRKEVVKKYGYKRSGGDEHDPLMRGLEKERILVEDVGPWASYCYRWDSNLFRISGSLGRSTIERRTSDWRQANNDHGDGESLTPRPVAQYFFAIAQAARREFGEKINDSSYNRCSGL